MTSLGKLLSGNVVAQAIPILSIPILSRYYTPESFGEWGLFIAVVGIATVLATGRLEMAIVVPEKRSDAVNLGIALLILSLSVSVLAFLMVLSIGLAMPSWLSIGAGRSVLLIAVMLGTTLWLGCIRQGFNYWLYRDRRFFHVSTANIIRSAGYCSVAIAIGLFQDRIPILNGLIVGTAMGEILAVLYVFSVVLKETKVEWPDLGSVGRTVADYRHFIAWGVPGDLLNVLANQLPLFFLSRFFEAGGVGQFVMSRRVLSMPTSLLSKSTGDVFVAYASEDIRKTGECRSLFVKTFGLLAFFSLPIFFILMLVSPKIFPLVLGSQWVVAGQLAQPISILCGLGFVASTLGRVLQVTGRQKLDFFWQVCLLTAILGSTVTVMLGYSLLTFTWYFSLSYAGCYLFYLAISYAAACYPKQKII